MTEPNHPPVLRVAVDVGGTFTDLVVEDADGHLALHKASTTPDDPVRGVFDVLQVAADARGIALADFLAMPSLFIHGTTRATNAIVTNSVARTALLTSAGHRDVLLFREGGRLNPFDNATAYPEPYIPRSLTFAVSERVGSQGEVLAELDEAAVRETLEALPSLGVEAVGVCLLWSIVNPAHELRVGELIDEVLPGMPYTLSHALNPILREYRRASSTVIDASLKPLMTVYMESLEGRLREAGFHGRALVVSSGGGALDASDVALAPIHSINSGPAMAPVAGRYYAERDAQARTAVIADTGGTTYDVSLVRDGRIPRTQETWLGEDLLGHITGFPAVDVKSIGAGGGSIARVDSRGLLHVGPESAGSTPGPVCYGRGGTAPTVTDACVVLGYVDPEYFLGGSMPLDRDAAAAAIERDVAQPLGLSTDDAALAIVHLATEHMVRVIEDITVNHGIDPRSAVLIGGGGAAGLNSVAIARRLGCSKVVVPPTGAALSAAGGLMSDLTFEQAATLFTSSERFAYDDVNALLGGLAAKCQAFADGPGSGAAEVTFEFVAEARYPSQVWDQEVVLAGPRFEDAADVEQLRQGFHRAHDALFGYCDPESSIEIVSWRARVNCSLGEHALGHDVTATPHDGVAQRMARFADVGTVSVPVYRLDSLAIGVPLDGPALIESPFTTIVLDPDATAVRTVTGSLVIDPFADPTTQPAPELAAARSSS